MENLPATKPLRVVACTHPFKTAHEEHSLIPGLTLWEILQEVQPDITKYSANVWVDDDFIPPALWDTTYPAPGSEITIRVIPQGGVGRIIGSIFITIAAIAVVALTQQYELFGPVGSLWAGIGSAFSGMAVGIVGNMVLNALIPPASPSNQARLMHTQQQDSPTYSLTGASNQANKYGPIPLVLGRFKVFPCYGAEVYTEIIGNDQYLHL